MKTIELLVECKASDQSANLFRLLFTARIICENLWVYRKPTSYGCQWHNDVLIRTIVIPHIISLHVTHMITYGVIPYSRSRRDWVEKSGIFNGRVQL